MMRTKLLLFSFILLCLGIPTQAADINAASCSQADVQTAVNSAVDGDRVLIPSGNCTYTSSVTITNKGITIEGAGIGVTILTNGIAAARIFQVVLQAGDPTFGLTAITFDGDSLDTGSQPLVSMNGGGIDAFRLHHLDFVNMQGTSISVNQSGLEVTGLIDNNTFDMNLGAGDKALRLFGADGGDGQPFSRPMELGTNKFIFIEDCTFNFSQPEDGSVDSFTGSRLVFRYNTVNNTDFGNHGADSGGFRGVHSFEIYENTFVKDPSVISSRALFFRSGSGVVYNNTWTGPYSVPTVANFRSRPQDFAPWGACDGTSPWDENQSGESGYACLDQIGHIFTENQGGANTLEGLYFWNNTLNSSPVTSVAVSETSMQNHLQDGRDYFSNTVRPGYTPFTYPHPLQGGGSGNPRPDPPTNLGAIVR